MNNIKNTLGTFWNNWRDIIEKLVRWFIFSVTVALLPIMLNYLILLSSGQTPTVTTMFYRGDILLISSAIAAGAIGELIGSTDKFKIPKYIVGGLCVILLFITSAWFASITNMANSENFDPEFTSKASIVLFFAPVFSIFWCIVLSEV